MEHESNGDTNSNWCTWKDPQKNGEGIGESRKKRSGNHPDYSIITIGIPRKVLKTGRKIAVTQTPVRNHQLMLVRKTLKSKIIIEIENRINTDQNKSNYSLRLQTKRLIKCNRQDNNLLSFLLRCSTMPYERCIP